MYRTGVSFKSKFEKLAFAICPTGSTADIPIHVLQAKELKEEISGHEMIGFVSGNGPEFDHGDEYDSTNLLQIHTHINNLTLWIPHQHKILKDIMSPTIVISILI